MQFFYACTYKVHTYHTQPATKVDTLKLGLEKRMTVMMILTGISVCSLPDN